MHDHINFDFLVTFEKCMAITVSNLSFFQGDSGGPLSCLEGGVFVLGGATSFGDKCSFNRPTPGYYSDPVYYKSWVESTMSGKEVDGGRNTIDGGSNSGGSGGSTGATGGYSGYGGGDNTGDIFGNDQINGLLQNLFDNGNLNDGSSYTVVNGNDLSNCLGDDGSFDLMKCLSQGK